MERPRIVIVGGGFGGLYAARAMKRLRADITLVDRRNFHLFQPLLYQVATGGLSPANIAAPLRSVLRRQKNVRVLLGEVTGFDIEARRVELARGDLPYDVLLVAAGVRHHYFGRPEWERYAPGLKTIEDATEIRRRILTAFEEAEREEDEAVRRAWLTMVVVGGGPTGVELAGAMGEIANATLHEDFRAIHPGSAEIYLIEGGERVLGAFPEELSRAAHRSLERLGVTCKAGCRVTEVHDGGVQILRDGTEEVIESRTVVWAAGVQATPIAAALAEGTGTAVDASGRLMVEPDLSLPNHPEVFAVGDMAHFAHGPGGPLPGVAPAAMQQGRYVAELLRRRLKGKPAPPPFRYRDKGALATIGRSAAVADLGWIRFSGWLAWVTWLFVHLMYLVQYASRILVFVQWGWRYITYDRTARLITSVDHPANRPP